MIVTAEEMKIMEQSDSRSAQELMETAGTKCAGIIRERYGADPVLVLCGRGNNGGDGFVIARCLDADVCMVDGLPRTDAAKHAKKQFSGRILPAKNLIEHFKDYALIVDCIYGYGYHGTLPKKLVPAFEAIEASGIPVVSVDINSGCEASCLKRDPHALHSVLTLALGMEKPFHALYKEHGMFREACTVDLGLEAPEHPVFMEMNEEQFRSLLPDKPEDAYKGTYGRTLLIGGSYGMAGALALNIIGARSVGASYLETVLDDAIYPILAPGFLTTVFHPVNEFTPEDLIEQWIRDAAAVGFGSGAVHLGYKERLLHAVLRTGTAPAVIDAEGLRLMAGNTWMLDFVRKPLILTPHIGEFCALEGTEPAAVKEDPFTHAASFAKRSRSVLVLKGPHTIVTDGTRFYINPTGNPALAQAGSGDLLTGIITGLVPFVKDPFLSAVMGVWFHGHLADMAVQDHPARSLDLTLLSQYAERFFRV
ncbi:MAG: NAD(P)H-hydrate dehydratase [Solobacterium sp.]|nr:NAD(P)H-hydrate dehydratase [Solobacterium sp.]